VAGKRIWRKTWKVITSDVEMDAEGGDGAEGSTQEIHLLFKKGQFLCFT
jgi:hypothetical protein